jgi:hypothetical protein
MPVSQVKAKSCGVLSSLAGIKRESAVFLLSSLPCMLYLPEAPVRLPLESRAFFSGLGHVMWTRPRHFVSDY